MSHVHLFVYVRSVILTVYYIKSNHNTDVDFAKCSYYFFLSFWSIHFFCNSGSWVSGQCSYVVLNVDPNLSLNVLINKVLIKTKRVCNTSSIIFAIKYVVLSWRWCMNPLHGQLCIFPHGHTSGIRLKIHRYLNEIASKNSLLFKTKFSDCNVDNQLADSFRGINHLLLTVRRSFSFLIYSMSRHFLVCRSFLHRCASPVVADIIYFFFWSKTYFSVWSLIFCINWELAITEFLYSWMAFLEKYKRYGKTN